MLGAHGFNLQKKIEADPQDHHGLNIAPSSFPAL